MPDKGADFAYLCYRTVPVVLEISYPQMPILTAVLILNVFSIHVRLRELEDQLQGLEATKPPATPELKFKVFYGINLICIEQIWGCFSLPAIIH